jgi:hypothetical protein
MLINPVLLCDHLNELAIFLPSPSDIADIAQAKSCRAKARASNQSFDGDRIEALALDFRASAELRVQKGGDVSQGVLHARSIGDAGTNCNQEAE